MHSKRLSLVLPLIAIIVLSAGMAQGAAAASDSPMTSGVRLLDQLLERRSARLTERLLSQENAVKPKTTRETKTLRRAAPAAPKVQSATTAATTTISAFRSDVLQLVNEERKKAGLPLYTYNDTLEKSAQDYSVHMRETDCFSHTACGTTLKQRMHASGYYNKDGKSYYYGENIARGQETAQKVMSDWMNSPSHKAAILSSKFREIGIGKSGNYWTQHFGLVR